MGRKLKLIMILLEYLLSFCWC